MNASVCVITLGMSNSRVYVCVTQVSYLWRQATAAELGATTTTPPPHPHHHAGLASDYWTWTVSVQRDGVTEKKNLIYFNLIINYTWDTSM